MSGAPYRAAVKRFGLLGHPVGHSVSPAMMRAAFDVLGVPFTYDAIDVADEEELARAVGQLRTGERAGFNVTVPHKVAACGLADVVGESAKRTEAANVLVRDGGGRVRAENTDAEAIVRVVGPMLAARRWALILGSGGAARAALVACEALGFRGVEITSRSWRTPEEAWERGANLPEIRAQVQFEPWVNEWGGASVLAGREADLVIQATSAGMLGAAPGDDVVERVPWEALSRRTVAFDVVYRPRELDTGEGERGSSREGGAGRSGERVAARSGGAGSREARKVRFTPFLAEARRRGLVVEDGLGMLVEQAALALELWLGIEPPRDVMRRAADEALGG